jgi:hypothetical protein
MVHACSEILGAGDSRTSCTEHNTLPPAQRPALHTASSAAQQQRPPITAIPIQAPADLREPRLSSARQVQCALVCPAASDVSIACARPA